jgi:hypothetical protein
MRSSKNISPLSPPLRNPLQSDSGKNGKNVAPANDADPKFPRPTGTLVDEFMTIHTNMDMVGPEAIIHVSDNITGLQWMPKLINYGYFY